MSDKQKVVAKYLLEDISRQLCQKSYSTLLKTDFELIDQVVSAKVIPLLSDKERKQLLGLGTKSLQELQENLDKGMIPREGLLKYETLKSWKLSGKVPGKEGKLILARYFDFPHWDACFAYYTPIVDAANLESKSEKRQFSFPHISINIRSLAIIAITCFIGIIAFSLFKMEKVFTRMAEDRPAIPRQIEKGSSGAILIANDSLNDFSEAGPDVIRPEKDLRREEETTPSEEKETTPAPKPIPVKKVSPRKAILELGLSWDAKSLAESMTRADKEAIELFVEGGFPLQSDYKGASVLLYAYQRDAIDPEGVTDQLIELGFDFTELLIDAKFTSEMSDELPIPFHDERLPKYEYYSNKVFQGTLMMWLAQSVMWQGEKNHELTIMKKLSQRWTFEIAPKYIYEARLMYGVRLKELTALFEKEMVVAKRNAFDLKQSLRYMRNWPETYEVNGEVFHPIIPKDADHIYVQKKGKLEIDVKPINAGNFTDRILESYMTGKNVRRFSRELETYGLGRNGFGGLGDKYAFVFLDHESEASNRLYNVIQPNFVNISTKMILVCQPEDTEWIAFLKKEETGIYDAATILTTGNPATYYLNLYADGWTGGPRVVVTKKNGQIIQQLNSVEDFTKYLADQMR